MPSTVSANGRPVVHRGSGDVHIVFPDVCLTPPIPIPIPYPNIAVSADTTGGAVTVKVEGQMPMVKGAKYPQTTGDESGTDKGVLSGMQKGEAEFMLYSFDVTFEGKNVCRLGDPRFHNKKNAMG